jgi:hypothetical protein
MKTSPYTAFEGSGQEIELEFTNRHQKKQNPQRGSGSYGLTGQFNRRTLPGSGISL